MGAGSPALRLAVALALFLAMWALQPSSAQAPPEAKDDLTITGDGIEQRARLLALSADLRKDAKETFQGLVRTEITRYWLRLLQAEVVRANPGKSREELAAIFKERQKELGAALQKQVVKSARARLLPKLRKVAEEELLNERLKLRNAKKLGIEVSDEEVKGLIREIAARNKMTYEEFARHLERLGVDIATLAEKLRAEKAWREVLRRR